ncbi:MAG: aldolase [Spirochaetales bacterium]|jgi:2-keto-3-deoxy-L-rhamnonate aldolase RhmA|nr:aldolase [Spirochaetales bacterium]
MKGSQIRERLLSGQRVYGTLLVSDSPFWPTVVDKIPGLDFVFIDTEHITIDDARLSWMCRTYDTMGLAPVVRIPDQDPTRATKVLDMGARGIIAPYVENTDQVMKLAGAVKYRPLKGRKLERLLSGDSKAVSDAARAFLPEFNRDNMLIINIESQPAIDNLDDLLAVQGLDAVLIGPHDLSINLGFPEEYTNPDFVAAVTGILEKARAAGKGAGIHYTYTDTGFDQEIRWVKSGANLIIHSADAIAFRQALAREIGILRETLGDRVDDRDGAVNI